MIAVLTHDTTVELLNKGHIGIRSTVPCREAVLISEVNLHEGKLDERFLVVQMLSLF